MKTGNNGYLQQEMVNIADLWVANTYDSLVCLIA